MYGDPDHLDAKAAEIRRRAQLVRDHMSSRMLQSETADWQSIAAEAWRTRVREETARAATAAAQLDDAAAFLVAHAQECREAIAQIAKIEAQVRGWLSEQARAVEARAAQVVSGATDAVEGLGRGFAGGFEIPAALRPGNLPQSGDVAWLGLGRSLTGRGAAS